MNEGARRWQPPADTVSSHLLLWHCPDINILSWHFDVRRLERDAVQTKD